MFPYFGKVAVIVMFLVPIAGCSTMAASGKKPLAGYPFRHADFDFKVAWKTSSSGSGVTVDGILKNVRLFPVTDMQLWVKVLNKDKRLLTEESTLFLPVPLNTDDSLPFSVMLKNVALVQGDMLNFVILYRVMEDTEGSSLWLSSFTVDALTGATTAWDGTDSDTR